MTQDTADWQAEVISLKEQGLSSHEIAEAVGKSASTVRKVIARATTETEADRDAAALNGNGNGHVDAETAERLRAAAEGGLQADGPIPGQIDIDIDGEVAEALADFKAEAGEAVGPMPPREMDAGEPVYVEQIRVDGTTQYAIDFGGREAESATLALAGKVTVDGFFRKGDRIRGTFEAVVTGAGGKDKIDKQTGVVAETVQTHSATITDLRVAS